MKPLLKKTMSEVIAEDFRTAAVFREYGLDSVCKGTDTLEEVCAQRNLEPMRLSQALQQVIQKKWKQQINFQEWPADLLINYIVKKHHRYVKEKTPILLELLRKIKSIHGSEYPELYMVYRIFNESVKTLTEHIRKEEEVVFPFISKMVHTTLDGNKLLGDVSRSNHNPIDALVAEHQTEDDRFNRLATISNGYCPPANACNTYRITYAMLKEFENNLREHLWLENDILVPKAIELEEQLMN